MDILDRLDRWKDLQLGDLPAFTKEIDWVAEIKRDIADARAEIMQQSALLDSEYSCAGCGCLCTPSESTPIKVRLISAFRDIKDSLK